jgi:thiol-disulfide isomerase/thioredoxin
MQQRARNRSAIAVVFFSLVTLSMSSCKKASSDTSPATPATTGVTPATPDTTTLTPHLKGKLAPDFTLTTLQGKQIRLSSLRGKPVVLNFWATWCGPCKMEMPWFQEFAGKYADRGLVVLGVANDDASPEVLKNVVGRLNITYPILLKNQSVVEAYGGLDALPETFYIDPKGIVTIETAGASPGASGKTEIQHNIDTLLAAK